MIADTVTIVKSSKMSEEEDVIEFMYGVGFTGIGLLFLFAVIVTIYKLIK